MRSTRGAFQGGEEFLGRIKVRKALGKIDRPVLVGEAGGAADDGLGEYGKPGCGVRHGSSGSSPGKMSGRSPNVHHLAFAFWGAGREPCTLPPDPPDDCPPWAFTG